MKSLLLTVLAAVGLSGCYAELTPYNTGYYSDPAYVTTGTVYTNSYAAPAYRPAPVYVSRPAPVYVGRPAPVYVGRPGRAYVANHHYRRF